MEIDPRGPRFSAVITTIVLAVVLITGSAWLLAAQVAVFAVGALAGLRYAPYGLVYRYLISPRLGPPVRTEPEAPPRFAQAMGLVIAGVGLICLAGRHRPRAGRGVPQRSLRSVPGLPRIPVHPAESKGPAVRLERDRRRRNTHHEPIRRPRGRRWGARPHWRSRCRHRRGGRGHQRLRQGPYPERDQDRLEEGPAGRGPA